MTIAVILVSMFAFATAVRCDLGRPAWHSVERLRGTPQCDNVGTIFEVWIVTIRATACERARQNFLCMGETSKKDVVAQV